MRFFAGYDFPEDLATSTDAVDAAYAGGVPMGGRLTALQDSEPNFLVMATADPLSAPLQRLQVIKGWIDEQGETHETVIDVACAGGAEVDPGTNRCPHNGATVDLSDCSINPETGAGTLTTVWTDPDFNPDHRSFYYARVIENPLAVGRPGMPFVKGMSQDRGLPAPYRSALGPPRFILSSRRLKIGGASIHQSSPPNRHPKGILDGIKGGGQTMTNKRDWQSDYEQRLLEPEAAMDLIEAGDWVNVNVGTPAAITVLLNARAEALGSLDMRMLGPGA